MSQEEVKTLEQYRKELPQQLSDAQQAFINLKTPAIFIENRQGRGGGNFSYVEVGYVIQRLNSLFGVMGWDFEYDLIPQLSFPNTGDITVHGVLTIRTTDANGVTHTMKKTSAGGGGVKKDRSGNVIDFADDLKSAGQDALKKCASYIGLANDVYYPKVHGKIEMLIAKRKMAEPKPAGNTEAVSEPTEQDGVRTALLRKIFAIGKVLYPEAKSSNDVKEHLKATLKDYAIVIDSFASVDMETLKIAVTQIDALAKSIGHETDKIN